MKAVSLLSGGKDSFLSTVIAIEQGMDVVNTVTVIPEEFSYMYHYPNADKASYVSALLGLRSDHVTEEALYSYVYELKKAGVETLISGAIASDYQKTRIEHMCTDLGLRSFTPLWRKDQHLVLREIVRRGIEPILVSVSAEGFTEKDLGRQIDEDYIAELKEKQKKYGINVSGEGGEYETFVLYAGYGNRINVLGSHTEWEGSHGYMILDRIV